MKDEETLLFCMKQLDILFKRQEPGLAWYITYD